MSSEKTPSSYFGIYDILTRIIPGFVMIVVFLSLIKIDPSSNISVSIESAVPNSGTDLILYATASFLVGEFTNMIRIKSHPVPYPFVRMIYTQTHDESVLTGIDRLKIYLNRLVSRFIPSAIWGLIPSRIKSFLPSVTIGSNVSTKIQHGFWKEFKYHFKVDDSFNNIEDIYQLLLSHMEPRMTTQLKRQQTMMHFSTNIFIVLILSVYFSIWFYFGNTEMGIEFLISVFFITIISLYVLLPVFTLLESKFIDKLLVEYYYSRIDSEHRPQRRK